MEFYLVLGAIVVVFFALLFGARFFGVRVDVNDTNGHDYADFKSNGVDYNTHFYKPMYIKH